MTEQRFVEYGGKRFPVPDGITQDAVKAQMARFFPELANPKIESKKDGDATVWVFSKQAGTKGADEESAKGTWAIVEIMGRKVLAGYVTEETHFGAAQMRVDVPATSTLPAFTDYYGAQALYSWKPVSEEVARKTAEAIKASPVSIYVPDLSDVPNLREENQRMRQELVRLHALPAPAGSDPEAGFGFDDDFNQDLDDDGDD